MMPDPPDFSFLAQCLKNLQHASSTEDLAAVFDPETLKGLGTGSITVFIKQKDHLQVFKHHAFGTTDSLPEAETLSLLESTPVTQVVKTGIPQHVRPGEGHGHHLQGSLMVLPVMEQGGTLGALSLAFEGELPRDPQVLLMIFQLASGIAQFLSRLQRSQPQAFEFMADSTNNILWSRDPEGHFVSPQSAWAHFTGQDWEAYQGMGWLEAIHPQDREEVRVACLQGIQARKPYQVRYRLQHQDGTYRQLQGHAIPMLAPEGHLHGWVGFHQDLTREERIRQSAQDSEARLAGIISTVSDAVITTNQQGQILVFNRAAERMFGLDAQQALGESLDRFIPDLYHKGHHQQIEAFAGTGTTSRSMHGARSALQADGSEFLVEATLSQVVVKGEPLFTAVLRDVTEQIRMEQNLQKSENRFRSTFNQAAVGIAHVGLQGQWLSVNQKLLEIVGYPEAELLTLTFQDITHPDDLGKDLQHVQYLLEGSLQTYSMHKRYFRKDGSLVWVNLTVSMVRNERGEPDYFIAVVEDISQMKQAEHLLIEARQDLEVRVEERTRELEHLSQELSQQVQELESHNKETRTLGEMGEMLQACLGVEEAQLIVAQYLQELLPEASGVLYGLPSSRDLLEEMVRWNGEPSTASVFSPHECWGLRRGKAFVAGNKGLRCAHASTRQSTVCVPLLAQGETVGLLHLESPEPFSPRQQRLTQMVAETVALALVNLKLRDTLRQQSIRDTLTGLFNRHYLEETFEREARRALRHGHPIGVIGLDMDHFKHFNDTYGQDAGDVTLAAVGQVLQSSVRGEDVACRYGGEEFALLLPGASMVQTLVRAEHIRQTIADLQVNERNTSLGRITVSVGVAAYPQHGTSLPAVLKVAEAAVRQAKQQGRNRVSGAPEEGPEASN